MPRNMTPKKRASFQQSGRDSWLAGIEWEETESGMIRGGDFDRFEIEQVLVGYAYCEMLKRTEAYCNFTFKKNGEKK